MCGRFTQRLSSSEFAEIFGARDLAEGGGGAFNVAPTQAITVVREREEERIADRVRWGFVPSWSDGPVGGRSMINARAETIATSPAFRGSFRSKRCIVPVDGFYEWQRAGDRTQPFYISGADGRPLAFAGIWSTWKDPTTDQVLVSCAVVTTTPNELMAPIHDRMPVVLPDGAWERWLEPSADPGELQAMLVPAERELVAWPVATLVNNPRSQGAGLVERIEVGSPA